MKLVRRLYNAATTGQVPKGDAFEARGEAIRGSVLTIGNYDGVHLGHVSVLERVKQRAAEMQAAASVMVFEPSSKEFIDPERAPPRLMPWREKALAFAALGIDQLVTLQFNEEMRRMSPEAFVERLIVQGLEARHVVVGDDFRYGANARGDVSSLTAAGERHGFSVEHLAPFIVGGIRVSSTAIRERVGSGDLRGAKRLLGRGYRISGRVVHGAKLGRTLGYPTANLRLLGRKPPLWGIYAVRVDGIEAGRVNGVASLGTRPTVDGIEPLLEVHIFDFDGDLYGRIIDVEFIAKLRDEVKFASLDALIVQMDLDAAGARAALSKESE